MIRDVAAFRQRFMLGCPRAPQLLSPEALLLRLKLMHEEVQEFMDANDAGDLPEAADALIDLVYIALGTALEMGLPWDELWKDVHRANMEKVRCESAEDSKRGSKYDLKKPPGWHPPNSKRIVQRAINLAIQMEAAQQDQQLTLEETCGKQ